MYRATSKGKIPSVVKNAKSMAQIKTVSQSQSQQQHFPPGSAGTIGSSETATTTESYRPTSQRLAHVDSFHMFKHSTTTATNASSNSNINSSKFITNKSTSSNTSGITNLKAASPTTLRYANLTGSALSPLNKKNSISSINLQNSGNKSTNNLNRSIHTQNPNNRSKNALSISSSQNPASSNTTAVEPFALGEQQSGHNQLSTSQAAVAAGAGTKVARLNLFDEQQPNNVQGIILEGNKGGSSNTNNNDATRGKEIIQREEEEMNANKKQNMQQQQQDYYPTTKRVFNQRGGSGSNDVSEQRQGNYDDIDVRQERHSYVNNNTKEEGHTDRQPSSNGSATNQKSQPPVKLRGQDSNEISTPNEQRDPRDSRKDKESEIKERDNYYNNKQNRKNNNTNNGYQQPYNVNDKQYPYDQPNNRSQGSYPPADYQDYERNNTNWGQQYERNRSNNERNPPQQQQYRDSNISNPNYQSDRYYPPMNGNPRYYNDHLHHPNIPYNDRSGKQQYYHDRSTGGGYDDIPPLPPQFQNGNGGYDKRSYQNSYHDKGGYLYDRSSNNYGYQGYPPPPAHPEGGYYRHPHDRDGYYYYDRDNHINNGRANNNDWHPAHDRIGGGDYDYPRNQMKQQRYKNSSSDFDDRNYNRYPDDRYDQFAGPSNGGSFQNDGFRSQNPQQDRRILDRNINNKTPPNEMRYVSECYPRMDDNPNATDRWRPPNAMSYDQFKQQNSHMINSNNQQNGSQTPSSAPAPPPLSHSQNNRGSRGEQQPASSQYPQYYMDKGYHRQNNNNDNYNNVSNNITDQKIQPPQSLPDRSLNKSANGFYEHHRSTPSGGSNYRPAQSPNQRYQGEYEYPQHNNNWMNSNGTGNTQQPYIQGRDKSPGTRFPPSGDRERTTPTGGASTNTDRLHSQQFSKREQQQAQQDDSLNFKNRSSFQDYTNNGAGRQAGGNTTSTASSRYQQQPDYASFQRKEQGQYAKEYMDLISKNINNNSIQDEPSSQPSKDTKRSFLKEMPENKPQEQPQQQLKEGPGGRTNSAASALENIKARGNLKSQQQSDDAKGGIGKQLQQQAQNFDDIPVKGMKAGMNFDDMPIKGGKSNPQQNFDDMPIKGGKEQQQQPQSYDDIPIKANNNNNNNKNTNINNRNLSQNFDDTPINGAKNKSNNNYDDMPIKGSSKQQQQQYNDQPYPSRTTAGSSSTTQSGFQSERNTPNNHQKLTGKAQQAQGKRRLETDDGWEGVGDELAVEEGVGMNNRQVYSREVKTLQSNYDSNDDRPIKPSNQGGKYDLKGITQQMPQQLGNKNSQGKGGAFTSSSSQAQQKMNPNNELPIPNKKVKLFECREGCGRSFAEESLAKHEGICKKVFQQKRKKFDSAAMRTDIEELKEFQNSYAGSQVSKKNTNTAKSTAKASENGNQKAKWLKQSEALRAVINANKAGADQSQQIADPKARALMNEALFGEEYVQCNFCNRRFNATAAKRHIPFCEKKAKENHGKVKENNNNIAKGNSSSSSSVAGNNGNKLNSSSSNNVIGVASKLQDKGGRKESSNIIQTTGNNNNNNMTVPRKNIAMNDRRQQY